MRDHSKQPIGRLALAASSAYQSPRPRVPRNPPKFDFYLRKEQGLDLISLGRTVGIFFDVVCRPCQMVP